MNNLDRLEELVQRGYLTKRPHESNEFSIYNYTQKTQYESFWIPETLQSRGLILTPKGEVIARPFAKFFNFQEHKDSLPNEPFEVYEKLDGSLGILYWFQSNPFIATRGSFTSEQAYKGTSLLYSKYQESLPLLNPSFTYLFEVIYPSNRIVVDYGQEESLVLLGVIETASGIEQPLESIGFPVAKKYEGITDFSSILNRDEENKEGFVIRFEGGLRLKFKFEEYVKLHRLLSSITAKAIWELLKDNIPFESILERVPDEFYDWIKATEADLLKQYQTQETLAKDTFQKITSLLGTSNRKELAASFSKYPYSGILFALLDGKDYSSIIWKSIKPSSEKPFLFNMETL